MNAGLDKNEAEFGVLVFAIALKMLSNSDSLLMVSTMASTQDRRCAKEYLLDQHVKVFGYFWCETCHVEITLSVEDQSEAVVYVYALIAMSKLLQTGSTVPFDLRMRRILLPRAPCQPNIR